MCCRCEKRDLFSDEDFLKYAHISNLTDWYQVLRGSGYNITLDPHNAATYYDLESSIIGVNSSSVVYNEGVRTAYIHHGTNASMIHFDLQSAKDTGDIGKRGVDPYGNGYDDEGFKGHEGFKGQWCHSYGNSETLNPVNDWSMMNQLVEEETGGGQTQHYNLWFFGAYDNNHNGAQIAGIEIEAETVIYKYNEEWSEEGICDTGEYMVEE
ncbi:hypothetical protein WICPIJ_001814 [Wickerhamomyces pijperi]|uniref:Uncharacterized protein n=1 Tax=Wickerhamomyces pijperi TaxID=599730 RepID=A0A9P8QD26_WICPI|nr:hypothetical protein WICPIJ_001814 [Wickerhamomyces pijperi]